MKLTPLQIANHACNMMNIDEKKTVNCTKAEQRTFCALFGASFLTISELWNMLNPINTVSERAKPKHLLWTLIFLKVNKLEPVHLLLTGCKSRDTFQNWVKRFAEAIANLEGEVIVFEN